MIKNYIFNGRKKMQNETQFGRLAMIINVDRFTKSCIKKKAVLANSTSCTLWQKERKERGKQDDWTKQIHEN